MTVDMLLSGYHAGGGNLSGDRLCRFADAAWALLLSETRGRAAETEEDTAEGRLLQMCFSRLVEAAAETEAPTLRSETLGQWKKSYAVSEKDLMREQKRLIRQYLGETGLLYRGWPG